MKKIIRILIICGGIFILLIPSIYFIMDALQRLGLTTISNEDGTIETLFIDIVGPTGKALPTWFMLLWGLFGLVITIIGIKKVKS